jgi:hypothetical protein
MTYSFTTAQWISPTQAPTGGNTPPPITVSSEYQAKAGDLGAVRMRAGQYCDENGNNCITTTSSSFGGGNSYFYGRGGRSDNAWASWSNITQYGAVYANRATYDWGNGAFVVSEPGHYFLYVNGSIWGCTNDRFAQLRIALNGNPIAVDARANGSPQGSQSEGNALSTNAIVYLFAGDRINFQAIETCTGERFFNFVSVGGFKIE